MKKNETMTEEQKRKSLDQQRELQHKFENTLERIASILDGDKKFINYHDEPNPYVKVSRIVCDRQRIKLTPNPNTEYNGIPGIESLANDSNIRMRVITLDGMWWKDDIGPMVAFISDEKKEFFIPVAVLPKSVGKYFYVNPFTNQIKDITDEEAMFFSDKACTFYRAFPGGKLTVRNICKFSLHGIWKDFLFYTVLGIFGTLVGLLLPELTRIFTDSIIPQAQASEALNLSIIVFVCTLAAGAFNFIRTIAIMRVNIKTTAGLEAAIIDRVLKLPVRFFRKYSTGELANRALSITQIQQAVYGTVVSSAMSLLYGFLYFFQLNRYSKGMTKYAFLFCLIPMLASAAMSIFQYFQQKKIIEVSGKTSGLLLQLVMGVNKLVTTGSEKRAFSVWADKFITMKKTAIKSERVSLYSSSVLGILPTVFSMVFYAVYVSTLKDPNAHPMSTGTFLAFLTAFSSFQSAVMGFANSLISSINVVPLYQYVKPILDEEPEVNESKPAVKNLAGQIEVNHIDFRYSAESEKVLKDVSFKVEQGEFVAIVGNSGSGKSTLLRVLLGFEKPERGSVFYDDYELSSVDAGSVRRQIGVVLQNSSIMQGSIFENIVGNSGKTLEDAWEAARLAGFDKEIQEMPMGMFTLVPAGGGTLSGGQRQRLIIAQALAKKPKMLFFDEATSALDNKTQAIVCKSLEDLHVTRIVVAHRLSTIINADTIYVLKDGEIIESGNYKSLMKQKGFFAELAKRQKV